MCVVLKHTTRGQCKSLDFNDENKRHVSRREKGAVKKGRMSRKRKIDLKRSKRRQRVSEEDFMRRRNSDCFLAGLDGSLFRGC